MNISKSILPALVAVTAILSCSKTSVTVVSTTRENPWMEVSSPLSTGTGRAETLVIDMDRKGQTIEGSSPSGRKSLELDAPFAPINVIFTTDINF